jgi:hypothetical protein
MGTDTHDPLRDSPQRAMHVLLNYESRRELEYKAELEMEKAAEKERAAAAHNRAHSRTVLGARDARVPTPTARLYQSSLKGLFPPPPSHTTTASAAEESLSRSLSMSPHLTGHAPAERVAAYIASNFIIPEDFELNRRLYGPHSGTSYYDRLITAYEYNTLQLKPGGRFAKFCSYCGEEGHLRRQCQKPYDE